MAELGEELSDRERDVLQWVMQGAGNKQIAQELDISPNTVKVHLRNIYTKLGVATRTEASMTAVERGLFVLLGDGVVGEAEDEEEIGEIGEIEVVEERGEVVAEGKPIEPIPLSLETKLPSPPLPAPNLWRTLSLVLLGVVLVVPLLWWGLSASGVLAPTAVPLPDPTAAPDNELIESNWYRGQALPAPRTGAAVVSVGVDLYLIGGEDEAGVSDAVAVYETDTHVWRTAAAKPTAVTEATAAQLLGIYVAGGRTAAGQPTDVVEAYSPSEDQWRTLARLPQPIAGGLTLSDGRAIYLFGGWNGAAYLDTAYVYDPASDAWGTLPPLPHPQAGATGGVVEGRLYVLGGRDETGPLASCAVYDPASQLWTACASLSLPRAEAGAAVVLNHLYVLGGTAEPSYGEVYDTVADRWQIINLPATGMAEMGWQGVGVANVEARIYLLGGRASTGEVSAAQLIYSPSIYQTFIPTTLGGRDE